MGGQQAGTCRSSPGILMQQARELVTASTPGYDACVTVHLLFKNTSKLSWHCQERDGAGPDMLEVCYNATL